MTATTRNRALVASAGAVVAVNMATICAVTVWAFRRLRFPKLLDSVAQFLQWVTWHCEVSESGFLKTGVFPEWENGRN